MSEPWSCYEETLPQAGLQVGNLAINWFINLQFNSK